MRCVPIADLVGLACVTTRVARLSPTTYEPRPSGTPIPLYSSQLPTCEFKEIAIVKAWRDGFQSPDGLVDALRKKAGQLGGDALVRVSFGERDEVTGTVIRFVRDDCRQ